LTIYEPTAVRGPRKYGCDIFDGLARHDLKSKVSVSEEPGTRGGYISRLHTNRAVAFKRRGIESNALNRGRGQRQQRLKRKRGCT